MNSKLEKINTNTIEDQSNKLSFLEQRDMAEELIRVVNQPPTTESSSNFSAEEINKIRAEQDKPLIEKEKELFKEQIGDVATLVMKLYDYGEKVVAESLAKIYGMNIDEAVKARRNALEAAQQNK